MVSQEGAKHRAPVALEGDARIHPVRTGACQGTRCKGQGQSSVGANFALQWCCCGGGVVVVTRWWWRGGGGAA
eukprot:9387843-Lingulodinium_polyedra.AAC.1